MIPEKLSEICSHEGPEYQPLVDYETWRVALMNYTPEMLPEKINRMQKHVATDEGFVLLAGRCILFPGEGSDGVTDIQAVDMEPYRLYNVKKECWHSHTFSADARVLIVENRDTVDANSPFTGLSPEQQEQVLELTRRLWG